MTLSDSERQAARRRFLRQGGRLAAGAALALSPLGRLLAQAGNAGTALADPGYGPLKPVRDLTTGLPLLQLPEGFSYLSFGWTGEPLDDGAPCPPAHDGMGIVRARGEALTLVRNHEVVKAQGSFAPAAATYDPRCSGGTVTLEFDLKAGKLRSARPSLSGTLQNCAGGSTPWGSWLSCEEFVSRADRPVLVKDGMAVLERDHGFVFEVPAEGVSKAEPLVALGQMRHEAATIDPKTGIVYLTEDQEPAAGFYRCLPRKNDELIRGGRLQMLKALGAPDLRSGHRNGDRFKVEWVEIEHPERGIDSDGGPRGLLEQGLALGGSKFTRLEGCIAGDGVIYFTATNGGDCACGQVWAYHPESSDLVLVFESPDPAVLDYPDNVVLSPRGGLLICQDSLREEGDRLYGLTRAGKLFAFAQNNVVLDGAKGFYGDYRGAEWAGSCYSPDGRWLFANVYSPGFSVAITGPWKLGLI